MSLIGELAPMTFGLSELVLDNNQVAIVVISFDKIVNYFLPPTRALNQTDQKTAPSLIFAFGFAGVRSSLLTLHVEATSLLATRQGSLM